MSVWTDFNTQRRNDHVAQQIATVKALAAAGYTTVSASRAMGMSERGLRRYLTRHGARDLWVRLERQTGAWK